MPAAQHIMQIIASETHGESYSTHKYCVDSVDVPKIAYDGDEKHIEPKERGETAQYKTAIDLSSRVKDESKSSLIRFFLDGSRRVYKVDDIAYGNDVFPVMAGQIGVGCLERMADKTVKGCLMTSRLVIALPERSNLRGVGYETFFKNLSHKVNERIASSEGGLQRLVSSPLGRIEPFDIIPYQKSPQNGRETTAEDRATAAVQDEMMAEEKKMVTRLAEQGVMSDRAYLIKDGSLEYADNAHNSLSLRQIKSKYRYVIGISKKFDPTLYIEKNGNKSGKKNPKAIADLPLFCRTPVMRYGDDRCGGVKFAVWYIRLRNKSVTQTPFDGVVKAERIIMDSEMKNGVDSEEIDMISAQIINERTPTCYGTDSRWANHLYPVYLTEQFIKSRYMSTEAFLRLF